MKTTFLPPLAALFLAGCAVGPNYKAPAPATPADFSSWHGGAPELLNGRNAAGAALPRLGWSIFGDPVLEQLQARALTANADVQTAALRFEQSRALRDAAASQGMPQLGLSAGATRQRLSETGVNTRLINAMVPAGNRNAALQSQSTPFPLYQVGFDASWELDLWGRVRRGVESAEADVAGAKALLAQVRLTVQSEVARNYFELRGTQRQIALTRSDIAAAEETLELVSVRASGGLVTDLDVTRQRAQLAELRAQLPQLLAQEAQALNRITLLLGETPGALQTLLASGGTQEPNAGSATLPDFSAGLPSEVARRRSDIVQAEAKLHAATANTGVAVADLYPRITIGAQFGLESLSSNHLDAWGNRQWSIGPHIQLPIFDGGRRRATLTVRRLQQQEAAIAYQQTVLRAWHEIDDALSAYAAERQRNVELAEKERASRDALALARVHYEKGLTNFLVQLDAQRTQLAAQRQRSDSDARLSLALVAALKALGGPVPGRVSAKN